MKGKVIRGKLLVQQEEAETKTAGGIIIPDTNTEKPNQGKVLVIGEAVKDVKIGDTVLWSEHAGSVLNITHDGFEIKKGEYVLLQENNVLYLETED